MPAEVFMLYFERRLELTIEAASREAALAAGEKACDENDVDEMCENCISGDEWTVSASRNPIPENTHRQGVNRDGRIVHISDVEEGKTDG